MEIQVSPKELREELKVCLKAKRVPYVRSSPGMGKSAIVAALAKDAGLLLIDMRLAQCTPEDLQGFPMREGDKAKFVPFDTFPLKGEELPIMYDELTGDMLQVPNKDYDAATMAPEKALKPARYNGWLLLLDELSSANKSVQAAAYKLILDRQVGNNDLHEQVFMVACGNLITDKAVVNRMSTALQSRLIHYELKVTTKDWINWAMQNNFDYRILAYIQFAPQKLMDFNPDHTDNTYPCPRTWDMLNDLVGGIPALKPEDHLARVAGTIGRGTASEFLTFCEVQNNIPDWADIIDNTTGSAGQPKNETLKVPGESSAKFAVTSMMATRAEKVEVPLMLGYIKQFPADFQVIFCRGIISRFPNIDREDAVFQAYAMKMITDMQ